MRELKEGKIMPKGYGIGWRDFALRKTFIFPIPLNILLRWVREFYFLLSSGLTQTKTEKIHSKIAEENYWRGYREGTSARNADFGRQLAKAILSGLEKKERNDKRQK